MSKFIPLEPLYSKALKDMTIRELRRLAPVYGIKGYGSWTRIKLIEHLEPHHKICS